MTDPQPPSDNQSVQYFQLFALQEHPRPLYIAPFWCEGRVLYSENCPEEVVRDFLDRPRVQLSNLIHMWPQ